MRTKLGSFGGLPRVSSGLPGSRIVEESEGVPEYGTESFVPVVSCALPRETPH